MSTGEDEPSSGLNGRLRPRKSNASPKTTPTIQKPETKQLNEKPKRTSTPSKVSPAKPDDVSNKTAVSPVSQVLCSFCDKTFGGRQAVAKHVKRVHSSTSKHDFSIQCLYCNHSETEPNDIIRHMIDSHPNQYFACLNCQSRFSSTSELAEHKLNVCEKQKPHYRNKLRQKSPKKTKSHKIDGRHDFRQDSKQLSENHGFNGIVISCELKPSHVHEADIEDNIPTNLILPPSKSLANAPVIEKNAVIVLDPLQISTANLQWNKRIPTNFNFHNTDADQILSRLGVVHRGPRTGEPNRRDWLKIIDETNQKFERCFDTSFYSKVASNVQENLAKFLDGSCNFNPDPDNTIKTRKLKNSVAINTAEGFPILLAFEQYSRNVFDGYMPRSIAPKHKWKWDNLEHDKTLSPEQIKRDSHANNCIITLVSSLDIWTQLCMRQKFEDKFKTAPIEKKAEKQNIIGKELKEILEKRELPTPSSQVVKYVNPSVTQRDDLEFPATLGLAPATPNHDIKPAVLSGEWVRPRCYICCACGFQARDSRALTSHITTQHPNAQIQHYEIVGERLLNSDISKHLYVPPSQVNGNRTRPLRGFRECTKCKKSISLEDLHQHMLDCAGDTPTVRRKCRARPFGVRKRRTRLPDNTIRKKIRKDIRTRDRHRKTLMRPRQKNRSDVGDAETIRKMLADLPAKRHRVLVNPLNSNLRPRRKFDKQRNKLKMKKIITDDVNKKSQGNVQSSSLNVGIEKLKAANQKEGDSRMTKSNTNQASNRQNSTSKRNSPLNTKRTLRLRQSKGTSDQGSDGKKCADSGDKSGSTRSGSGGSGEAPFNTRENGNQSNTSNGHDNQQPGCSRQNDNNRESTGQPPNVPLKHSIARLTANTGTHDKSVQFHHLFLVQQECNNIPQHVPTRQRILFENEAAVTKLDKPPLNNNHGGTMDPTAQKSKLNKPRKGLNDCIAMLKNKLVEPSSQEQVSIQCDIESPSTSKAPAKNYKPPTQASEKSKVTHEIAIQCADLDSDEPLAQALMRERRASQRQQALANIAKQAERDANVQSTSQGRQEGQVEESPKKDKAKSKTAVTDTPKIEIAAQSNQKNRQNNDGTLEIDKGKIEVLRAENYVTPSVPLKGRNDCQQEQTKNLKEKEKVQLAESNNSAVVSIANVCQNNYSKNDTNKETTKPNAIPESPECPAQNILPKKKRNLKGHQENLKNEKAPSFQGKPTVEKKEKMTKETQKKNKGIGKKLSNTAIKKVANLPIQPLVSEKSILPETIASHAIAIETKKKYPKRNKTKLETISLVTTKVLDVRAEKPFQTKPKENPKFKKAVDIPIVFTEVTKDESKNPEKTPLSEPQKNIPSKQKSDAVIPRTHDKGDKKSEPKPLISENLLPEVTKTDSIIKSIEKENGTQIEIHSQKSDECHKNLVPVIAVASNSTMETQASLVEPNTENRTPKEDDSSVYSFKQIPQNLTIQDSCEDLSMKEQTELHPDIPPAHCNIHIDSIIPIPLDLSGKISSTQSESPAPYPISSYDDTYETLDLSNKNPNRDSTFNRVYIDEEVVDLRVKYPSHMHYESDLSMQSMSEEATDLSITNEQLPKDLSLKSTNRSSSRICAMQGADYSNTASNRSNYEYCNTSKTYDENACLDFSLKETAHINHPTDLSGKRESRIEPLVSTSSHIENRSTLESNSNVSGTANISNTLNYNNSRMSTYGAYNKLAAEEMINHSDRTYINPNPIISLEHIPKDSYEPAINLLKRKTYLEPEDLIAAQELTKDYYLPTRTNVSSGIIISESNEQLTKYTKENYTSITKMPLCISESVKTSIPEYNLSNRVIVTSTKKYESTTPVYTHANACISISKVETNNSDSLSNSFMSIPGNTITNTTSVYTLAGTTTGNTINYGAECNAISIDIQSQSLKSVNDVMESSYQTTAESAEVIVIEDKLQCETDRKQENLDQDPDIAKKIALLPKELVEILGTMPVDHRKQLLNVLPQYVSTASKSTTHLSNIDQGYSQKSMTSKSSLSPDLNKTLHSNLDATDDKRQQLHIPTTPPSTLPAPSSQLSPTSISSSLLLTPPTPNIVRQVINVQRDLKTADCESSKNINSNIIDLTEDDNSQTMPEAEVHTTTEITNIQTFTSRNDIQLNPPKSSATKTNNDKTASLRAVRIKTQSERQRSIFPDIKVRKDSSEVPVTPLQHIDTRDKVDTKGLKIQQGEISSSQCINKNIECEISSSVSLNTELEVKSDEYLKAGEKEILQPNMIVGTSCEVGTNQILDRVSTYKRYDVCSTTLDKSNDSDDSKDTVQVSTVCPTPIQSDNIISNNNNVVLKPKKDNDIILSSEVKGVSTEQITKSSDDDSSDDDVSLAVIVKQRNRDKLDLKIDIHPSDNDVITNSNSVTSSVSSAEIKTDTSDASKTDVPISEESELKVLKNTITDPVMIDVKNKKKSRKTRRSLSVLKSFQHTTDNDSDINKENTKILHSENTKNKEDDIKLTHKELESVCVSSSNSEKDIIKINASHSDDTQNKILEEQDFPQKAISANAIPQVDSSLDKLNKIKLLELTADVQTSIKNIYHNSSQETANPDISLQKSLNTKVVSKKVEIKIPSTDNIDKMSCADAIENEPLRLTESGTESITESLKQQQNTITPLRRSRRGKSLFIDSNVVSAEESSASVDIISEQKMPLTKKQLIFSKLLLDEEHNVPPVSNNCEKLDNQAKAEQTSISSPNVGLDHIVQNYVSDSKIEQQASDSLAKTNKRKKSVQVKKINKKKKLQQECSTLTEHKNQLKDDNITTLKKDQKLVVQKLIETLKDDIVLSKEKHNSEESSSTTPDKKDALVKKSKILIDNTLDTTFNEVEKLESKNSSVEKRKPDEASDIDSAMTSLPKKSKINDTNKEEVQVIPKNQEDVQSKKVLINLDPKIADNKVKTRTTCYNKPIAAKRPRSKSVFVNSSDYYDPYDIDLEEMNETPKFINRKLSLRKPSKTRKTPNLPNKSHVKNKRLSEGCDAVPSTSKTLADVEKTQNKEDIQVSKKTLVDTKESISDSDDSSKSDVPLKKYVEEKEKKMLDNIEKSNISKQVDNIKDSRTSTNSKTKKKVKRSKDLNNKTEETKNQNAENEAQLRSEQFMESFGFFSERKPRKSNLLATKKISETLHIIANETDDVYFGLKERSNKKTSEKRQVDGEKSKGNSNSKETKQDKKAAKRGRKKKNSTLIECSYCQLCKKEFRRPDNFLRHQMSVAHVSKISEIELNVKVPIAEEEPNYLLAFKLQLDRVKMLHEKISTRKKLSLPTYDIIIPNLEEMLADAKRSVREKQICNRGLSRDEALFIDCCELLKGSHNKNVRKVERVRHCSSLNCTQSSTNELDWFSRSIDDTTDHKNDGDVDSITARNILESDEVRNLEKDLFSGLQEAAKATKRNIATFNFDNLREIIPDGIIKLATSGLVNANYGKIEKDQKSCQPKIAPKRSPECKQKSHQRSPEYKEKMYPDINIESIDMFEDKFDKIKRKCRSQAAAASKQPQATPEANASYKIRKNKKKGKKKIRNHQNTVLTKAALKGFDGIKVSIVTTEINMSGIMSSARKSSKKKKKNQSKRKRERKSSEVSSKTYDSRQDDPPPKKLDIYEFMDTDDAEIFDFRPSTIMERFKSISNKEIPSTSKNIAKYNEADVSSDSASDGDDFVYMSDDYVCSDDETENSVISCEIKSIVDQKKSPHKRKDTTEKSAVMGKIFKHNALRTEKKISKSNDIEQPKANLDQLFDSLLEEKPQSSKPNETITSKCNEISTQQYSKVPSPKQANKSDNDYEYDIPKYDDDNFYTAKDDGIEMQASKVARRSTSFSKNRRSTTPTKRPVQPSLYAIPPTEDPDTIEANKYKDSLGSLYSERSTTKNITPPRDELDKFLKRKQTIASPESMDESNSDDASYNRRKSTEKPRDSRKMKPVKSHDRERRVSFDCNSESLDAANMSDDAGVARQRVRRKCTVGKQNILAETWSSESEPDGMPPRPNSAESVVGTNRRRKGRKREGHSGKKPKLAKRTEVERASKGESGEYESSARGFARPGPSLTAQGLARKGRPAPSFWSEGEEQEHVQQHGWIVGDSHKKLVTMLAHAKGRKRDDKRPLLE
ncbi:uncharacterized protein LOC121738415 [Aricia agestis]|uniref:uncharacterized protein LOC121738415 n=1 Tax=Aricia agestis TaxID=91739 RepID=UPI001C206C7F|nr:uncharacterized protein LOC121738415 [Aricia agestis]